MGLKGRAHHKMYGSMPVDLIRNVQGPSSTFRNGDFALLRRWKVPCHMLEFGMLN